jgi:hypothetical protein
MRAPLLLSAIALAAGVGVWAAIDWLGRADHQPPAPLVEGGESPRTGRADLRVGQLLSPGPLARPHEQLDGVTRCTHCHGARAASPDARCLACHAEIGVRARRRIPYHGTLQGACVECHSEHRGRAAPLVELEHESFAHGQTRFALDGQHAVAKCERCHEALEPDSKRSAFHYQGIPFGSCAACHSDPHAGAARTEHWLHPIRRAALDQPPAAPRRPDARHPLAQRACDACHSAVSFELSSTARFDHDRDTRFALRGSHASVDCRACHTAQRLEQERASGTPPGTAADPACASCHRDPHRGALGTRCESCHVPRRWNQGFDHARDTRFALDAQHLRLRCESCHTDQGFGAAGRECADCHRDAAALLAGRVDGFAGAPDFHFEAVSCLDCHGRTPESNELPGLAQRCARCHTSEYAALLSTWRAKLDEAAVAVHTAADRPLAERLRRSGPHGFALARETLAQLAREADR